MAIVLLLLLPLAAAASSQKTFRGEVSVEQGYQSNIDRVHSDPVAEHESRITPRMIYTRSTGASNLRLAYSPSLVHSYRTEEQRIDQRVSAAYNIQVAKRLGLNFNNTYRLADDPYTYAGWEVVDGEIELSDRRGRRQYWTNSFSASMDYEYGQQRLVSLGYNNRILQYEQDIHTDFVQHSPFASISHRINHRWSLRSSYTFTQGDFDGDDDRTSHSADFAVSYALSPHTDIFSRIGYAATDYEQELQAIRNFEVYTATVGLDRQLSPLRSIDVETGVSQIKREAFAGIESDILAFFLRANLDNQLQRGSWRLYGESGTDQRYYTGIDEGLSRYWLAGVQANRTLTRNITGSAGVSYREDDYIEREVSDREKYIRANARLRYSFARWYQLTLGYSYSELESSRPFNNYENHRVFIRLTAGKDLFSW